MEVSIREFEPGDEIAFRLLNVEWITRYFELEAKDRDAAVFGDERDPNGGSAAV